MNKKLKDAIYGLAVGDALGVPFEFKERLTFYCNDMIGNGTHKQPIGTWSDDTSMTLATCDSIKNFGSINCDDIRGRFEKWLFNNQYTPFGKVFDCGFTCSEAIYNKEGSNDIMSNGNGSLMRILPLAFIPGISDEQIKDVSAITHAHDISKEGCLIYMRIAQGLINGNNLSKLIDKIVYENSIYKRLRYINSIQENQIKSTGYIVDTLEAAIWCILHTDNYKDCVLKAVNLGGDTDTIAAVAGGLAGIIYGYNNIPMEWINNLQAKNIIDSCLF